MGTLAGTFNLDVNTSGAWKSVLRYGASRDTDVRRAAKALCDSSSSNVAFRITSAFDPEKKVIAYLDRKNDQPSHEWRDA